jgi:hypothetical protein
MPVLILNRIFRVPFTQPPSHSPSTSVAVNMNFLVDLVPKVSR